jgi:hypothetical protein
MPAPFVKRDKVRNPTAASIFQLRVPAASEGNRNTEQHGATRVRGVALFFTYRS